MDKKTLRTILSATWVVFGLAQAVLGAVNGLPVLAVLGVLFAVLGAAYYWAEVYRQPSE